jgi:hypothetical protein
MKLKYELIEKEEGLLPRGFRVRCEVKAGGETELGNSQIIVGRKDMRGSRENDEKDRVGRARKRRLASGTDDEELMK